MSLTNWLFGACGRNHIGMYTCSRCGYGLVRSGFAKNFAKPLGSSLTSILPPSTIEAKEKKKGTSSSFNKNMVADFTNMFNLKRFLHTDSIRRELVTESESNELEGLTKYELSCGKCGNSLGHQLYNNERNVLSIKFDSIDLTFKPS